MPILIMPKRIKYSVSQPELLYEEGIARMAAWAKKTGARQGQEFENIEITEKLPDGWNLAKKDSGALTKSVQCCYEESSFYIVYTVRDRSPGQRFRFEQYLSYLNQNGYRCNLSFLLNETDDKAFYSKGKFIKKVFIYFKTMMKRTGDWLGMNKYDIIFIFRDALMTGSTFFEKRFARSKAKLIFDFDDAIWLQNVSEANKKLSFLKNADKTGTIIKLSDLIFAGNQYLDDYASRFNPEYCYRAHHDRYGYLCFKKKRYRTQQQFA